MSIMLKCSSRANCCVQRHQTYFHWICSLQTAEVTERHGAVQPCRTVFTTQTSTTLMNSTEQCLIQFCCSLDKKITDRLYCLLLLINGVKDFQQEFV